MKHCPKCHTKHKDSVITCDCGHTFTVKIERVTKRPDLLPNILAFPWLALSRPGPSYNRGYQVMGSEGSAAYIVGLATANAAFVVIGLLFLIGRNPYIDLARNLAYPLFDIAFVFLALSSFLAQTVAHFACFRLLSGEGDMVAHAYLSTLATTNFNLLYWFAITAANFFRRVEIYQVILVLGGLYLLVPITVSLGELHRVSTSRAIVASALSVIPAIPLLILYLLLFSNLRESIPYQINDWGLWAQFTGMALVVIIIVAYMLEEQKLSQQFTEGVPILDNIKAVFKRKWIQISLNSLLICLVTFTILEILASL